jgi:uncharacterized protein (DUF302 family)
MIITTRNILFALVTATVAPLCSSAHADNGIVRIKSANSVSGTINKLETAMNTRGMTIFKRISHSDGAAKVDLELRPTELLIFGNPKVGTPLLQCSQTAALDLPQKALAYEDANGQVWLLYNDPQYIADRHNAENCEQIISKISNALANFARVATN